MIRRPRPNHHTASLVFVWLLGSLSSSMVEADPYHSAIDLDAHTVWHSPTLVENPTFRWILPTSGLATVSLPGAGSVLTLMDGSSADDYDSADYRIIERSADRLVMAIRSPGSVYLSVTGQSISRLDTRFVDADWIDQPLDFSTGVNVLQSSLLTGPSRSFPDSKDLEPEVVDPDPDGLVAGDGRLIATWLSLMPTADRKDLEPEVVDPDPDGLVHDQRGRRPALLNVLLLDPVCRPVNRDDHGDTLSCATPLKLGRSVLGKLENQPYDDADAFSFQVPQGLKVRIDVSTDGAGLALKLSDEAGRHLALDPLEPGHKTDASLTSRGVGLAPGRYFLTLYGPPATYSVQVSAFD